MQTQSGLNPCTHLEDKTRNDIAFYDERWSKATDRHAELSNVPRERIGAIMVALALRFGSRGFLSMLDYGCGNGWMTRYLRAFGQVTGIDVSPEGIRQAAECYPEHRFTCHSVFDDFLPGEQFDVVLSQEVLEHVAVEQQPELLARCRDRLKPDGLLVLTTPNRWAVMNRRRAKGQSLERLGDQPIENILSVRELRTMAKPYFHIRHLYTVRDTGRATGLHRLLYSGQLRRRVPGWIHLAHLLNAKIYSILIGAPR